MKEIDRKMIGKKLYSYVTFRGIFEYEIIGEGREFLLAKCLVCNGCVVKLNRYEGHENRWKYVSMFETCGQDTYGHDEEKVSEEHIWHNDSPYFESLSECKEWKGKEIINKHKRKLYKLETQVKQIREEIKEIELWMNKDKEWIINIT